MAATMEYEIEIDGDSYEVEAVVDVHEGEVRELHVDRCWLLVEIKAGEFVRTPVAMPLYEVKAEVERLVDGERQHIEELCRMNAYDEAMDGRISAYKDGGP